MPHTIFLSFIFLVRLGKQLLLYATIGLWLFSFVDKYKINWRWCFVSFFLIYKGLGFVVRPKVNCETDRRRLCCYVCVSEVTPGTTCPQNKEHLTWNTRRRRKEHLEARSEGDYCVCWIELWLEKEHHNQAPLLTRVSLKWSFIWLLTHRKLCGYLRMNCYSVF